MKLGTCMHFANKSRYNIWFGYIKSRNNIWFGYIKSRYNIWFGYIKNFKHKSNIFTRKNPCILKRGLFKYKVCK